MALRTTTAASTRLFGLDIAGTLSSAISSAGGSSGLSFSLRGISRRDFR